MIATTLKQFAVKVSDAKAFDPVVRHLECRGQGKPLLRVLAYHRIDAQQTDDPYYPGLISTSPAQFAMQMDAVERSHYVCTMAEVVAA